MTQCNDELKGRGASRIRTCEYFSRINELAIAQLIKSKLRLFCLMAFGLLLGIGCATNPDTNKRQWIVLSDAREIRIGRTAKPKFIKAHGGLLPSGKIQQHVNAIGVKMADQTRRKSLPWEFHVLDSSVVNAFALPGGKIFISRGLLSKLRTDAQLAGVLAHEVGHVAARHANDQMVDAMGFQGAIILTGMAKRLRDEDWLNILGIGVQAGGTVIILGHSRENELQADRLAVQYMAQAGYNPRGHLQVLQVLTKHDPNHNAKLEFLSTHPLTHRRKHRLETLLAMEYPDTRSYHNGSESFAQIILSNLVKLPPPKHTPERNH